MKKKVLIEGMSCHNCIHHVTEALSELTGVRNVTINLEEKYALADVEINVKDEDIKVAVSEAGYEVVGIEAI